MIWSLCWWSYIRKEVSWLDWKTFLNAVGNITVSVGTVDEVGLINHYVVFVAHMVMINCFCGMVNQQKTFSLISVWGHCQRSSPSRILLLILLLLLLLFLSSWLLHNFLYITKSQLASTSQENSRKIEIQNGLQTR